MFLESEGVINTPMISYCCEARQEGCERQEESVVNGCEPYRYAWRHPRAEIRILKLALYPAPASFFASAALVLSA